MNKWLYGDSWEKYPIVEGETWLHKETGSKVSVRDLRDGLPEYMRKVDMVYCDPPWSKGNVNSFVTKAGFDSYVEHFEAFMDALFLRIKETGAKVCYLEIGKQRLADFQRRVAEIYPNLQTWRITYYRKNPCYLVRGGLGFTERDFTELDDEETPGAAIAAERPATVADMCMGRGLTMLAAHNHGATFYGSELNRRRLAVAIDRAAQLEVRYEKHCI